jgi:hypothetical protein
MINYDESPRLNATVRARKQRTSHDGRAGAVGTDPTGSLPAHRAEEFFDALATVGLLPPGSS